MLFNSFEFIFVFLPLVISIYFIINKFCPFWSAKFFLVIASLLFYSFFKISYLPLLITSILVNYGFGTILNSTRFSISESRHLKRKLFLIIGVIFNVGLLGYFKYMGFFVNNLNAVFSTNFPITNILLPLGISFFTFHQLAFLVDSYKGKLVHPGFLDYANFVTFFPQLIAGPIVFPTEMLPQFTNEKNRKLNYDNLSKGFMLFSLGLVKKVVIADSVAVFARAGFDVVPELNFSDAWLTSISYALQLYFDFSGYCDMAIGIAWMFNINLPLNFNAPYKAQDFQDFWRRWHITLGRFMTQYLYIPLGGNRKGKIRTLINLMVVFLISGIWHGAGWTFIIWGFLHGMAILIHRLWKETGERLNSLISILSTFFFVNLFWIFFRSHSLTSAFKMIGKMFSGFELRLSDSYKSNLPSLLPNKYNFILLLAGIVLIFFGKTAYEFTIEKYNSVSGRLVTVSFMVLGVLFLNRIVPFLYFNF